MKKISALVLAFCMLFSIAASAAYEIDFYRPVKSTTLTLPQAPPKIFKNGTFICEGEEMDYYAKEAEIVYDDDASNGMAITAKGSFQPDPNKVENITMQFSAQVPEEETGTYYIWLRIKCINDGQYSFHEMYGDMSSFKTRYFTPKPDYQWVKLASVNISDDVFGYNVKYRDNGFRLDKFIITKDSDFAPVGKDDLPREMGAGTEVELYPIPEAKPPVGKHPRLFANEEIIPQLKANAAHPLLSTAYSQVKQRGMQELDCKLPDKGGANNYNADLMFNLRSRAYLYLLGDADKAHAQKTIRYMRDMFDTVTWDTTVGDITRQIGLMIATSACVYDWCYDALTDEDKAYFIKHMKKNASLMEIGYPPSTNETFAGHGGEGEVFYFQLACGIAVYDEDPDMYNFAAGLLFEHMFETRELFFNTGNHPAGSVYGSVRASWEQLSAIIFDRMGYPGVMGEDPSKVSKMWIYNRLPSGFFVEDGDSFIQWSRDFGPYYNTNADPVFYYGSYFGDMHVRGQFYKAMSLTSYSASSAIYNDGIIALLTVDPNLGYYYPDDYGNELPLSYTTSYPLTAAFMRTSWKEGIDSDTAVVFMNGQEKLVGDHDHDHSDIGNFQIYYKGTLAGHGGNYNGDGWGSDHYFNYYRRTVSKNCVTVFDPDEIIGRYDEEGNLKYHYANDGGQKIEKNSDYLPEYLSHPDEAKTESIYIGPNEETPEFTYLKTDLTNAYSDKIKGYNRSMVALNLFNSDYPMAFICYDNLTSSDKSFKKTWNLQTVNEPVTTGDTTVVTRDDYDFSGKLVLKTMVPDARGASFTNVGGPGKDSYVNGVNYPNPDTGNQDNEQCDWRLEISPKKASTDDIFLNAMYVTDTEKNLPELPMYKEEMGALIGATVMDRTVLFAKNRTNLANSFNINIRDNGYAEMCVLITDLSEGRWQITGANGTAFVSDVTEDSNSLYARLAPGSYTVSPAPDASVTRITYPRDERVDRLGDFYIYNITARKMQANIRPTVIKDGHPYVSADDMKAFGAQIVQNGNSYTLTNGVGSNVITLGSLNAVQNGVAKTLSSAPFVDENGVLYINPLDHSNILKYSVSYDSLSRILKLSVRANPDTFSKVIDISKIVEPINYFASSNDGNEPTNLFDYNYKTRWSAEGTSEFLIIDYGTEFDVDKLMISFLEGDKRKTKFEILVSLDGDNYTEVFAGESGGATTELEAFNVNARARYIKLLCHGNTLNNWNSLSELIALRK